MFHGHVTHIPKPRNSEERRIRHEIVKTLYSQYNIIVPTRNPSNILQSWMHAGKRAVVLLRYPTLATTRPSARTGSMHAGI